MFSLLKLFFYTSLFFSFGAINLYASEIVEAKKITIVFEDESQCDQLRIYLLTGLYAVNIPVEQFDCSADKAEISWAEFQINDLALDEYTIVLEAPISGNYWYSWFVNRVISKWRAIFTRMGLNSTYHYNNYPRYPYAGGELKGALLVKLKNR